MANQTTSVEIPCAAPAVKSDVAIFKFTDFMERSRKREVYVPQMVSLGPYHHTNAEPMKSHKARALHRMMTRFNIARNDANPSNKMDFSFLAKQEISQLEDDIRKMYEKNIDCTAESLTLMLILDGCFILEILRTLGGEIYPVPEASKFYEPLFERNKININGLDILNDILKLENQIPWIVFRKLLKLELNSPDIAVEEKLFNVLVKSPSSKFYPFKYDMTDLPSPKPDEKVQHLLSLLHSLIVHGENSSSNNDKSGNDPAGENSSSNNDKSGNDVRRIPRAVELKNVGIKFKRCNGGIKQIDFNPKSATIFLPPINITDPTEVLFRNLIALEVCKASTINYVTCYVRLMDELIDTREDVTPLRDEGIVTYIGSDEDAAQLFNGLLKGVTISGTDEFKQLKQNVDAYYRSKFKIWFAELMKEHFSSPWRSIALAAAILVLLFTAVQTIFSVYSVYK